LPYNKIWEKELLNSIANTKYLRMAAKKVFLTFDDGPGPKTVEIAEILHELGIKATFFMLGTKVEAMPGAVRRVAELGHEIGVHGYEHRQMEKSTLREQVREIRTTAYLIARITGQIPKVYRAAYGVLTPEAREILKRTMAEKTKLRHVDWSYDTLDWKKAANGEMLNPGEIIAKTRPGDVILFHDGAAGQYASQAGVRGLNLVKALPKIAQGLRAKGLEFEPIAEPYQKGTRFRYKLRTALKNARAKMKGHLKKFKRRRK
jgi:peptidoglycan/xylan/chitin deacetylase (PgdA/CDA1 family)